MSIFKKSISVYFSFCLSLIFLPPLFAAEKPLVALLNKKIQTQDSAVILEKVVIYPDEHSLYGQGQENYGMPVKDEYKKGPLVVLHIEKYLNDRWGVVRGVYDWVEVELFSDGKKLGKSGGGQLEGDRMVFAFNFFIPVDLSVSGDGAIELEELGELELKITIFKVVKIFDLPLHDVPRGENPLYEDENVQVWETVWGEKWNKFQKRNFTGLNIGLQSKTKLSSYYLTFQGKGSNKAMSSGPAGRHIGLYHTQFYTTLPKSELAGAQLWKIVPALEKTIPSLKFIPQ